MAYLIEVPYCGVKFDWFFRDLQAKMRNIFVLFLMIMLAGCDFVSGASNQGVKPSQAASKPPASNFPIEPNRTDNSSDSKLLGVIIDQTATPVLKVIPGIVSPETDPMPSAEFTRSPSGGTVSEEALEILGQHVGGNFILQKIQLINQPDYTSCGEAAFAMGWNYRHPELALDIGMVIEAGLKLNVYFTASSETQNRYLGTSPVGMEAIGDYYAKKYNLAPPTTGNIDLDKGGAYARLEAKGLLYTQLSTGNPVIIEVTDSVGNPNKIYNDSHYVIVTGMNFDTDIVTYNDPLVNLSMSQKYSGLGRLALWNQIWESWFNNKDINPGESGHPGRGWYMIVN
jgi:hypothetical protein